LAELLLGRIDKKEQGHDSKPEAGTTRPGTRQRVSKPSTSLSGCIQSGKWEMVAVFHVELVCAKDSGTGQRRAVREGGERESVVDLEAGENP
jgi:hypothetical protein